MTDPITPAMAAASEAVRASLDRNGCGGEICAMPPCACAGEAAAAAVIAFLRALPAGLRGVPARVDTRDGPALVPNRLAGAIRALQEDKA